jgi:predicted ATPase
MNPWTQREAFALVDAMERSGQISADTATQARTFIDRDQPSNALALVRLAAPYVASTG